MMQDKDDDFDLDLELEDDFLDDVTDADFESSEDVISDSLEEDDFAFGSDDFEEDIEDDLGWDDEDEIDSAGSSLGEQKKSALAGLNLSFNTIVIGGAVIVGLFVLGFQVTTKKPQQAAERFISSLNMNGASDGPVFGESEVEKPVEAEVEEELNQEKAFLFNPTVLDNMDAAPSNGQKEEVSESNKIEETTLTPLPEVVKKIEPVSVQIPRAPASTEEKSVEVSEVALEQVTQPEVAEKTEEELDILTFVDEAPIEEVVEVDVPSPMPVVESDGPSIVLPSDVSGVQQAINALNSRLDNIEGQLAQVRDSGNTQIQDISESLKTLKQEVKVQPVVSVKTKTNPVKKAPVKRTVKKSTSKSVVWELRAAQPGKAWVSKKGQSSIQSLVVGDILSGIGRITAISYESGRWIVRGDKGVIRQ